MAGDHGDTLEDALLTLKGRNSRYLQALHFLYKTTLDSVPQDSCRQDGGFPQSQPIMTEKRTAWAEPLSDPEEDTECYKQFRAQPVPAHVLLPLYGDIVEQQEERRRSHIQRRKNQLITMQKPFRFHAEERSKLCERSEASSVQKPSSFIKPIPKLVLDPTVSDRLKEAELLRKINSQMRAQDLLRSSSAPIAVTRDPGLRTSQKSKQQRLAFLQQNPTFQPRTNQAVPDFQRLHRNFQKLSLERQQVPEPTQTKPFKLRTSQRDRPKRQHAQSEQDKGSPPVTSSPHLTSLSPNTLPVYITDSTKRREATIRSSLQDRDSKEAMKEKWLRKHQQKSLAMKRSLSQRAKALDPHTPLADANHKKLRDCRESDRKRTQEYKKDLEEMKRRVTKRAFLFEQVSKGSAIQGAESRFTRVLQQAGLSKEFVEQKGSAGEEDTDEEADELLDE
ncbi:protein FAM161B [Gastrophryne carolinensis]